MHSGAGMGRQRSLGLAASPWCGTHPELRGKAYSAGTSVSKWSQGPREGAWRKRRVRCLLSPLCQWRAPRVQGCPASRRFRLPGGFHPQGRLATGLGLRTKVCDFESVVGQVYTEDVKRLIGERWEVINLPLSWSKVVVQAFLAVWSCTVEASFRASKTKSATVWSAEPPLHHRLQHDFGCGLIRPAVPRKLVQVYKSKVLSFVEFCTSAVYHATKTTLAGIDAVQTRLLRECGLSDEEALFIFSSRSTGGTPRHRDAWFVAPIGTRKRPEALPRHVSACPAVGFSET